MGSVFVNLVFVLVNALLCSGQQEQCGTNHFYDSVTKSCAPCSDICDYADIQGTIEHCSQECPQYKLSRHTSTTTTARTTMLSPAPQTVLVPVLAVVCPIIGCIIIAIACLLFYKCCRSNNQQEQDLENRTFCWKVSACVLKKKQTNQHQQNPPDETALTDHSATEETALTDHSATEETALTDHLATEETALTDHSATEETALMDHSATEEENGYSVAVQPSDHDTSPKRVPSAALRSQHLKL